MVRLEDHLRFVNYIADSPDFINEHGEVEWVLKEAVWRQNHNYWRRMPDLIFKFHGNHFVLCEVKHSYCALHDACEQIDSGADYLAQCMHVMAKPRGVVAFYSENYESLQYIDVPVRGGLLNVARNNHR